MNDSYASQLKLALIGVMVSAGLTMAFPFCVFAGAEENPAAGAAATPEPGAVSAVTDAETGEKPVEKTEAESKDAKKKWFSGTLGLGFDGRWSDEESDINLDQSLRFKIDPPQYERLHLRGSLWMHEDLDSDERASSVLRDVNDAYDRDVRARLLYLYAEMEDLWGDSVLRIGRQRILEGTAFNRIDGAYFKKSFNRGDGYVFGGARASVYADTHDDWVLGGGASYRILDQTRLALDVYWGEEDRGRSGEVRPGLLASLLNLPFPRRVEEEVSNTQVSFSVWQDLTQNLRAFGRYTVNDEAGDELQVNFTGYVPKWDFAYSIGYRRLLDTIEDRVSDLTGFYRILGPYNEYDDILATVHKPLTKQLVLSLEAEMHNARGDSRFTGNRDYLRYAGILTYDELLPGLDATVVLERWDVDGDEDSWTVTGEVTKDWGKLKLTVGADYEVYKDVLERYNPIPWWVHQAAVLTIPGFFPNFTPGVNLLDQVRVATHENVYSVYSKVKWSMCANHDITTQVSYEEDDGPESPYWRVRLAYEIQF